MGEQKEVRIKYDKQSMTVLKGTSIVATILFIVGIVLMFMEINGTEILMLFVLYIGAGLSVACYGNLLAGWLYMKRLKCYGYQLPEKKRDYDGKIENLPKLTDVEETSLFYQYSIWGARFCIFIFAVFVLLDVFYLQQWKFMGENCKAVFVLCFFFYLVWIVLALVLTKQSNKDKYRDDVETDTTRKERWSLEQILFTMIILCLLSLWVNNTAYSMTKYIFAGYVDYDMEQVDMVRKSVIGAITECKDENGTVTCEETYNKLCEGVDITTWGVPKDEMQTLIAEAMNVEDFSLLRDDYKLSDGDAKVFVKITNEKVTVRLLNPVKEVSEYSRSNKEIYVESDYDSPY
ncbi:MAG: hypothetical protein ACI4GW_06560 [Lachnospiraceae bacterium]